MLDIRIVLILLRNLLYLLLQFLSFKHLPLHFLLKSFDLLWAIWQLLSDLLLLIKLRLKFFIETSQFLFYFLIVAFYVEAFYREEEVAGPLYRAYPQDLWFNRHLEFYYCKILSIFISREFLGIEIIGELLPILAVLNRVFWDPRVVFFISTGCYLLPDHRLLHFKLDPLLLFIFIFVLSKPKSFFP